VQTATSVTGEWSVIPGMETSHVLLSHPHIKKLAATTKTKFLINTSFIHEFFFKI
jgi:hypothetical protein